MEEEEEEEAAEAAGEAPASNKLEKALWKFAAPLREGTLAFTQAERTGKGGKKKRPRDTGAVFAILYKSSTSDASEPFALVTSQVRATQEPYPKVASDRWDRVAAGVWSHGGGG
jgi:hypothetical protein